MKKYFIVLILVFLVSPCFAKAAVLYSQKITLSPGWNVISTPKVLDSHSFSVAETSDNFDIYALDSSKPTGWATLADLGQTQFTPLFGYFVNNKTGILQRLTFNYKDVSIPEQLFSRTFSTPGWNSFGIANSTYSKNYSSDNTDTNNPDNILNSLIGASVHYGDVVDFTDANYGKNQNSVAVANPWKDAIRSADIANNTEINNLNDFRETKGYAIYIKDANSEYTGLQNVTVPPAGGEITLIATKGTNNPIAQNVRVSDTSTTSDVLMNEFKIKATGSDLTINTINLPFVSNKNLNTVSSEFKIIAAGSQVGSYDSSASVSQSGTISVALDYDLIIPINTTMTFDVYANINKIAAANGASTTFGQGDNLKVDFNTSNLEVKDQNGDSVTPGNISGASTGEVQTFYSKGINASNFTSSYSTLSNTGGTVSKQTFNIGFSLTAFGNSYYIPKVATQATLGTAIDLGGVNGIAFSVVKAGVDATGGAVAASSTLTSSALTSGSRFELDDGDTKTFNLTIELTHGSAAGFYRIQLGQVEYDLVSSSTAAPAAYTFAPTQNYQTADVKID